MLVVCITYLLPRGAIQCVLPYRGEIKIFVVHILCVAYYEVVILCAFILKYTYSIYTKHRKSSFLSLENPWKLHSVTRRAYNMNMYFYIAPIIKLLKIHNVTVFTDFILEKRTCAHANLSRNKK